MRTYTFIIQSIMIMAWVGMESCTPTEMKEKPSLDTWLEDQFPAQFVVVRSLWDIHPKHLYAHKHNAIVALKAEPEAQFDVTWYGDQENLGLDPEEIRTSAEQAAKDLEWARMWYAELVKSGLEKVAVGVIEHGVFIQVYGEPNPAFRETISNQISTAFKALANTPQTHAWIDCMEDSVYRKETGDIIPLEYWRRKDSYHDDHKIYGAEIVLSDEIGTDFSWQINSASKRNLQWMAKAYPAALAWAEKNQQKPFYLEPVQLVWAGQSNDNPMLFEFLYPLYSSAEDAQSNDPDSKRIGYIKVIFNPDQEIYTSIQFTEDH